MTRLLLLRGWFRVHTPLPAEQYLELVIEKFIEEFAQNAAGTISRESRKIRFRRKYPLLPYSTARLASFSPGEVCVQAENNFLLVRYYLGINPVMPLIAFLALLVLYIGVAAKSVAISLALGTGVLVSVFALAITINFVRVHLWLKSAAMSVVIR